MFLSFSSSDGVGRSGTFLCIHSQLERLKTDGEVDAFKYLKTARTRRQGLVAELVSSHVPHHLSVPLLPSITNYISYSLGPLCVLSRSAG